MFFAESPLPCPHRLRQRRQGVDVDDPHGAVAALHRHADRLPHAGAQHAVAGAEAIVVLRIAGEHPLPAFQHVVEDCATDGHCSGGPGVAVAPGLRMERASLGIEEHDAAAIRFDPFKHQLQDAVEQFVDVECVADRQGGAIHHLQVAAGPGQPAVVCVFGHRLAHGTKQGLIAHGTHDPRAIVAGGGADDVDIGRQRQIGRFKGEGEHAAADMNLVAAAEIGPLDPAVVDERAVGALEIGHGERLANATDLGVAPGNLVVVELDRVARLTADAHRPRVRCQIVAGAAIAALDDVEQRHVHWSPDGSQATARDTRLQQILAHPAFSGKRPAVYNRKTAGPMVAGPSRAAVDRLRWRAGNGNGVSLGPGRGRNGACRGFGGWSVVGSSWAGRRAAVECGAPADCGTFGGR